MKIVTENRKYNHAKVGKTIDISEKELLILGNYID